MVAICGSGVGVCWAGLRLPCSLVVGFSSEVLGLGARLSWRYYPYFAVIRAAQFGVLEAPSWSVVGFLFVSFSEVATNDEDGLCPSQTFSPHAKGKPLRLPSAVPLIKCRNELRIRSGLSHHHGTLAVVYLTHTPNHRPRHIHFLCWPSQSESATGAGGEESGGGSGSKAALLRKSLNDKGWAEKQTAGFTNWLNFTLVGADQLRYGGDGGEQEEEGLTAEMGGASSSPLKAMVAMVSVRQRVVASLEGPDFVELDILVAAAGGLACSCCSRCRGPWLQDGAGTFSQTISTSGCTFCCNDW